VRGGSDFVNELEDEEEGDFVVAGEEKQEEKRIMLEPVRWEEVD